MHKLLYTSLIHSATPLLIPSLQKQFLIPYSIHVQCWSLGTKKGVTCVPCPPRTPDGNKKHSMVSLSLLKSTPNITHMWFRPQDPPKTSFSTLFHHQTTNLTPKALKCSRFCWSFQVETKDGIISHITSQMLSNYIKLLSPQALWFRMSSPNPPLLNIFITLRSYFLVFIFHLAKQNPRQKPNQYECGWMRGLLPWFCRQLHPSPVTLNEVLAAPVSWPAFW